MAGKVSSLRGYKAGDPVVYPTHGLGEVVGVETTEIDGDSVELMVIKFDQARMTLRLPVSGLEVSGLRSLAGKEKMGKALTTLTGKARAKRAMWSRRAQEYEGKINSGDPVAIAEVLRDLFRKDDQPEQSYSERQLYQSALDRLAHELAVVESINKDEAEHRVEGLLERPVRQNL